MRYMKEVDWIIAPEGATHYNVNCFCPWLKESPPSYFVENMGTWIEYDPGYPESHFINAVKRPEEVENEEVENEEVENEEVENEEWDGKGVPPVGTECEYSLNGSTWFTCKTVYMLSGADDCFVAWCAHLGIDQFLTFSSNSYKLQLRKIKTPEQIAEEERLQAIDEMYDTVMVGASIRRGVEALYDAGYRKPEVKK